METETWKSVFTKISRKSISPFIGWNYSFNYENKYFSNISTNRRKKSYQYKSEPRILKSELLELENLNKLTSLEIKPICNSQIAIIGCGPVGMATGLWLRKLYPNLNISIYETRIDSIKNEIKPFSRRWLTEIKLDLLEPILNLEDISIFKKIGLANCLGVDIRNVEYALLRAINNKGIRICQLTKDIPKPKIIIDASGGKFITHNQSEVKKKLTIKRRTLETKDYCGQKASNPEKFNQFEIIDFGNIIKPFHNGFPFQVPYLKINFLPTKLKDDFIYFSNVLNLDHGIYYWNGFMQYDLNYALLFISLSQEEFLSIDDLIDYPIRLDQAWNDGKFKDRASNRLSLIFEWFLSKLKNKEMCYLEPLFLWEPYFCPRKEEIRYASSDIEYLTVGDSHYIGNPKMGNGLRNHLSEIKYVFSRFNIN